MTPPSIADLERALDRPRPAAAPIAGRVAAGVCVPVREGSRGLEVWVIKRPSGMRHHAREIAFPGGKPEPQDPSLLATALRETQEELGIDRDRLRPLGPLDPVPTATSLFTLNPWVAEVMPGPEPVPNPAEVDHLIRVPVADFFAGAVGYRALSWGGGMSPIFVLSDGSMYGASAHVLFELLEIVSGITGTDLPEPEVAFEIPWA